MKIKLILITISVVAMSFSQVVTAAALKVVCRTDDEQQYKVEIADDLQTGTALYFVPNWHEDGEPFTLNCNGLAVTDENFECKSSPTPRYGNYDVFKRSYKEWRNRYYTYTYTKMAAPYNGSELKVRQKYTCRPEGY